ncbi:MAG: hypothetical protein H0W25_20895, partial [Acidimicrobiia bacterium]|nr:hypothetical protein [Acidimicrobiia bacterium]
AIAATGADADQLVRLALLLLAGGLSALFLEADQRRRRRRPIASLRRASR